MSGKSKKRTTSNTKGKEEEIEVETSFPEESVEIKPQLSETSSTLVSEILQTGAAPKSSESKVQDDKGALKSKSPDKKKKKKIKSFTRKQKKKHRKKRRQSSRKSRSYSIAFYDLDSEEDEDSDETDTSYASSSEFSASETDEDSEDSDLEGHQHQEQDDDDQQDIKQFNSISKNLAKIKVKVKLPKLRSTRVSAFKTWQEDFQNTLSVRDLDDLLKIPDFHQALKLTRKDPSFDFKLWKKLSQKLYALVRECMPDQYKKIIHTFAQNDGAKAFEVLNEHVRSKSQYRQNYLLERLANTKMRQGQDPSEFLTFLIDQMDELETTGERFPEKQRISKVLSKLPAEYDNVINTFEILPKRKRTLLTLKNKLDAEFKKKSYRNASKPSTMKHQSEKNHFKEKKTHLQTKSSHVGEKVWSHRSKSSTPKWIQRARCFKCNKVGHLAKDCPESDEGKSKTTQQQTNVANKTTEKYKYNQEKEKEEEPGKKRSKFQLNIAQKTCKKEDWSLQLDVYEQLKTLLQVQPTLDPFATSLSAKCENYFTIEDNAFQQDWHKHKVIYLNPSYRDYCKVLRKFVTEGNKALAVFPHWPKAKWFQELLSLAISPVIVLPNLEENVFINTQREIKHSRRPSWSALATVIQAPRNAQQQIRLMKPSQNEDWSVEKNSCMSKALQTKVYNMTRTQNKQAYSLNTSTQPTVNWLIDSGCNNHATGNKELFVKLQPYGKPNEVIEIADGIGLKIEGIGCVKGITPCGVELSVQNVLYVPNLAKNILSFNQLETDQRVKIKLRKKRLQLQETHIKLLEENKLVYLQLHHLKNRPKPTANVGEQNIKTSDFISHAAFGHPGRDKSTLLTKYYGIEAYDHSCGTCKLVKNTRNPFFSTSKSPKATYPYEKLAADLTTISTTSCEGHKYISGFKDEYSGFLDATPIKSKSDTLKTFKSFLQNYNSPDRLLTDNGTEYTNHEFNSVCEDEKIKREFTCPYSSQQNGSMERSWRTLIQVIRANLKHAGLPKVLWNYAAVYSSVQMNCWPRKFNNQEGETFISTPWEQFCGVKPNPKHLKVFGCDTYCYKFKHQRKDKKLSKRGKKGVFLGLPPNTKGYLILDPSNNEIFITRDVTFDEANFTTAKEVSFEHVEDERDSDYSDEEDQYYSEEEDAYLSSAESEEPLSEEESLQDLDESEDDWDSISNSEDEEIEDSNISFKSKTAREGLMNKQNKISKQQTEESTSEGGDVVSEELFLPSSATKLQTLHPTTSFPTPNVMEEQEREQGQKQNNTKQQENEDLDEWERQDGEETEIYPRQSESETPQAQDSFTTPTKVSKEQKDEQETRPRRSQRLRTAKPPSEFWKISSAITSKAATGESSLQLLEKHDQKLIFASEKVQPVQEKEPTTFKQAMKSEEREEWKIAIENELQSLQNLNTWVVVDTPPKKNIIQPKWVFKRKTRDGILDKYKARLVAKGFTQTEGIDYFDTFSPVARHSTTRLFIANATQRNRKLLKVDIKNAYLNAPVKEEIYLHIPEGLRIDEAVRKCLKLQKSLYGLKQSARNWYEFLVNWLSSQRFQMSKTDPCLFYREEDNSYVLIYVDDILVDINPESEKEFKKELESAFTLSEYEELKWHLGLTVNQGDGEVYIHQKSYIEELTKKFHLEESKPVCTPTTNQRLSYPQKEEEIISAPYRSIVGGLLWLSTMSRPDLTFPVHDLSRHLNHPTYEHWNAAKRALKYAFHTRDFCVHYNYQKKVSIVGYSDADWIGDQQDSKSTSGYIFLFNETPISWSTVKQTKVALSTCEAEYMALAEATKEVLYLHKLFVEMKIPIKLPIPIYVDNKACITISENPAFHKRTKHIAAAFHFVRDTVRDEKIVKLIYVPTDLNLADIFTKPLIGRKFYRHRDLMLDRISFEEEC